MQRFKVTVLSLSNRSTLHTKYILVCIISFVNFLYLNAVCHLLVQSKTINLRLPVLKGKHLLRWL